MTEAAGSEDWLFYEAESFKADVSDLLSEFELNALRQQLARDPFAGTPVPGLSPLCSIDFAGATIVYSVKPSKKCIVLVQIAKATGKPIEVDEKSKAELKELAGMMKKGGFFAAGKEAIEWLWDVIKDWWL